MAEGQVNTVGGDDLDPEIRAFVQRMGSAFAAHPPFAELSPDEIRRVAEQVRAPMAAGGPAMATTRELTVETAGRRVRVRLYDPGVESPKPVLVYMHGGGWTMFSLDTHDRIMREYAARAGVVVAGVDYALSPEARFPQARQEVIEVVRWLSTAAAELGLAGDRIALGGDSAGANLAVSAAIGLVAEGIPLRGLVLNYGVYDPEFDTPSHQRYRGPEYMLTSDEMAAFWQGYIRTPADLQDPRAAVLHANLAGLPPAFLAIPECDVLLDENTRMADALRRQGVAVEARIYAGATHSFLEAVSMAAVAERAFAEASAWLADRLREAEPRRSEAGV